MASDVAEHTAELGDGRLMTCNDAAFYGPLVQRIRELRCEQGFAATRLSMRAGLHRSTVSRWECGQTKPDMSHLVKVAAALNVEVWSLFPPTNEWHPGLSWSRERDVPLSVMRHDPVGQERQPV